MMVVDTPSIESGDKLRVSNAEQALAIYATCSIEALCKNTERIRWILSVAALHKHTPLLERLGREAPVAHQRAALNKLGQSCWNAGETERAEEYWSQAMRLAKGSRDRQWITSVLNMGLAHTARDRMFSPLLFFQQGREAALTVGDPYRVVFATARRGELFVRLGYLRRAEAELASAFDELQRLRNVQQRQWLAITVYTARGHLLKKLDRLNEAYITYDRAYQIVMTCKHEGYALSATGLVFNKHLIAFERFPEKRAEILEEIEQLPEQFAIGGAWSDDLRHQTQCLRIRYLAEKGDTAQATALLLNYDRESGRRPSLPRKDLKLAKIAEQLNAPAIARSIYDRYAATLLKRVADAQQAALDFPELRETNPDDWSLLTRAPIDAMLQHEQVSRSLRRLWNPDHPTYELMVQNGMVIVCAWCKCVQIDNKEWLPLAQRFLSLITQKISHGICPRCEENVFGNFNDD